MGAMGNRERLDGARAIVRGNVALGGPDTRGKVLVRSVDEGAEVGGYPIRAEMRRGVNVLAGEVARREWLEPLAAAFAKDEAIDIAPVLNRLNLPR